MTKPDNRHLVAHCGVDADPTLVGRALSTASSWSSTTVVDSPTALRRTLEDLAATPPGAVVVMPMTSGRNLTLISDTAKVCRWARTAHPNLQGRLTLADAPLSATTTIAWLRTALRNLTSTGNVAVVCSRSIDPFSDAELFRLARLAWVNGSGADVAVAFDDAYPTPDQALAAYHAPGEDSGRSEARHPIIRADLHQGSGDGAHALLSDAALAVAVAQSAKTALHLLHNHDDDGIDAALLADHDHGYAHSHGDEGEHSHNHHSHTHVHGHTHHGHHHSHNHGPYHSINLDLGDNHAR